MHQNGLCTQEFKSELHVSPLISVHPAHGKGLTPISASWGYDLQLVDSTCCFTVQGFALVFRHSIQHPYCL